MDFDSMSNSTNTLHGQTRRTVMQGALASGLATLGLAGAASVDRARAAADASKWPKDAFSQKTEAGALKALYGKTPEASDKVSLDAPEIAENGAVVPISVTTALPGVTSIAIIVAGNPFPLAAHYVIPEGTSAAVANRLKLAKTTNVIALVEAGGKVYSATKEVKVTVGGCGG
ncbi:MAG: thiosulfate oxidation carrier protein SoxY [Candidatus Sulfotelmatobacter sp.]